MALVGRLLILSILPVFLLAAGCAPWQPAAERSGPTSHDGATPARQVQTPPRWYPVKQGDTLYSIAFRFGLDWRALAGWNQINAPYTIRPGQELRMSAPPPPPTRQTAGTPASERNDTRPASPPPAVSVPSRPEPAEPSRPAPADVTAAPPPAPSSSSTATARTVSGVAWQWPTDGNLSRAFDAAASRKGIGIAGTEGQAIRAAAAGEVVYSGTGLIGYGELIIVKHSDQLLSAYGHNRRRLVTEGDRVSRGQQIAEMGLGDRHEHMLHFEIRLNGQPVNPVNYLPAR